MKRIFAFIALSLMLASCATPQQGREIAQERCGDNHFVDYYTYTDNVEKCNGF